MAVSLNSKLPYDPLKDFTPITMIASSPYVLVLYPGVPAKNVGELIALARSKPGVLNYGSAGPASLAHLAGALFATLSDIQLTHVPYKSTAQSVVDLIAGRLDMQFATIAPSLANIRADQLRALAVTGKARVEALPEVPTMAEAGVPGYEATLWFALMAPASLPTAITSRLNREAVEILNSADMKETLAQQGFIPEPGTPAALNGQIRRDITKWKDVIPKAGITAGVTRTIFAARAEIKHYGWLARYCTASFCLVGSGTSLPHIASRRLFSSAANSNGFCNTTKPWRTASWALLL